MLRHDSLICIKTRLFQAGYDAVMNPDTVSQSEGLAASQFRRADGLWEGIARVSGMDCGACAVDIQHAARQVSGFKEFSVNPASHLAHWVAVNPIAIDQLVDKTQRLGYILGLQKAESGAIQAQRNRRSARSRFLRFLVAALCMMQIMMYSTPEYIFAAEDIGLSESGLLRWAQWVLALPLMLYCAIPYYKRAWAATVQGRLVMDQPIVIGLLLAFVLSSLSLGNMQSHVWFDSIAMLLTLLLLVQMLVDNQTAHALNHLATLQPDMPVQVDVPDDNGGWKTMPVALLRAGQVYRLNKSQAVPVDSEFSPAHSNSSETLWVDEAMRTGEADPVAKHKGDLVQAGSRLLSEQSLLRVTSHPSGDSLLSIGQLLLQALAAKPGDQDKVDRILPWFVFGVLVCAAGTALYWGVVQSQAELAASATLAVLIVTCPCALALALPLVRLFGIRRLADAGVLVRNPQALDTLAKVNVVAMDKTGTLATHNAVQVSQQAVLGYLEITDSDKLNALCMLAKRSAHPLSRAVAAHLFQPLNVQGIAQPIQWLYFAELPGAGLVGVCKLLDQSVELRLGSSEHCGLGGRHGNTSEVFAVCVTDNNPDSRQVLKFAVNLQTDGELIDQLAVLNQQGLSLNLLSGDQANVVERWMPSLKFDSRMGGMSPEEKVNWIASQQANHHCVAMVGDGLNDSGAFAQANVSFAAWGASTLSAGQADFLMTKPGMAGLVSAVNTARMVETIGRQNLFWALAYNGVAVPVATMGLLTPWMASVGMGLSSLLVFMNALRVKHGR